MRIRHGGTAHDRDRLLAMLRKSVMRQLALDPGRDPLGVVAADGSRPIVFALEQEPLSMVMLRVSNAGGVANVFVGMTGGEVRQLALNVAVGPRFRGSNRAPSQASPTQ